MSAVSVPPLLPYLNAPNATPLTSTNMAPIAANNTTVRLMFPPYRLVLLRKER